MVRVIAHRGASAAAPENTIEAFRLARDLGVDYVELDARRTRDDVVVVHHDAHLPDGRALIESTRSELPAFIPDLVEVLDLCHDIGVNIEIKNSPDEIDFDPDERIAEFVVAELDRRRSRRRTIVSSFHRPSIERIRSMDMTVPTAFLHHAHTRTLEEMITSVGASGHHYLHPWDGFVDERYLELAEQHHLRVNVWTVDDPVRMRELVDLGVHGICTNVPDVLQGVLAAKDTRTRQPR